MKLELQKYLERSSIHGLVYISRQYHIVERIFWSITLTSSIICIMTLIIELWIKMKSFPIVAYLSDTSVSVAEINFPAVTLCPEFLPYLPPKSLLVDLYNFNRFEKHTSERYFYEDTEFEAETIDENRLKLSYVEILSKIDTEEIQIKDLGFKILNRLQVVDMMLNLGILAKFNQTLPEIDFLDVLNEFDKEMITDIPKVCFRFRHEYNRYISEVLTPHGLCFSFNIALAHDLLDLNITTTDFHYEIFISCYEKFARYLHGVPEIPRNDSSFPTGLNIDWYYSLTSKARKNLAGHYMFLHDPYELPSTGSKKVMINVNHDVSIKIIPQINRIDDSIADYDPVDRNCYLETERTLKFFKRYTKVNCIQECLTDFMINRCGCAEFFMIRNSTTRICLANEKNCAENAKNDFEAQQQFCKCLQPCNYVKYDFELIEKGVKKRDNSQSYLLFDINYDKLRYNPMIWKEQFHVLDFFSYFGGLLGLLAGVSVLSIVEILYWFTIRLFQFRSNSRVKPFDEHFDTKKDMIIQLIKKYIKESSIHGLEFLLNNNIIQRSLWTFVIIISGIGCFYMISETRQRIPVSRIVAYDDNFKSFGYIYFPSITFLPATLMNKSAYLKKQNIRGRMYGFYEKGIKVPDDMLRDYAVVSKQVCDNDRYAFFLDAKLYTSYNLVQFNLHALQEASRLGWFRNQSFWINGEYQPVFAEVPTYSRMAYSFNLLDAEDLLNMESNIPESKYYKNLTANGNTTKFIKNLKVQKSSNVYFSMKFKKQPEPRECDQNYIFIHSNDQTPRLTVSSYFLSVNYGVVLDIEAVPEVIRTDTNLKTLSPAERECYFDGERKLKYYKKYSMQNCISECFSNYSINQCGCVFDLYNPASVDEYCKFVPNNYHCSLKYKIDFHALDILSSSFCSCLPSCDSVSYHIKYFHKFSTQSDEMSINLRVNTEDAILFRRYQQFTFSDVISYVGGLLGLFAGISMLSIVEIFYFFVIRIAVDVLRAFKSKH